MAIKELQNWFDDRAKNGFKIDGLKKEAGNIPTGNDSADDKCNHFIVTPQELAKKYKQVYQNPDPEESLSGDLSAMLSYTKEIYTHSPSGEDMLNQLRTLMGSVTTNQKRANANMKMLKTDAKTFKFAPDSTLNGRGFTVSVKKELYRFPSILLLDVCLVVECIEESSWHSLRKLLEAGTISEDIGSRLKFLLGSATFIRLSAYLYHDSQDDRMSLAPQHLDPCKNTEQQSTESIASRRWVAPSSLIPHVWLFMTPLQTYLASWSFEPTELKDIAFGDSSQWLTSVIANYYCEKYFVVLSSLKKNYPAIYEQPVDTASKIFRKFGHPFYTILADVLVKCGEDRLALKVYHFLYDSKIYGPRDAFQYRIAHCHHKLREYKAAINILKNLMSSPNMFVSQAAFELGCVHTEIDEFEEAERNLVKCLQTAHDVASCEELTNRYGEPHPMPSNSNTVELVSAGDPNHRLGLLTNMSHEIVDCIFALGNLYTKCQRYDIAENYYKKALQLAKEFYGENAAVMSLANIQKELGYCYKKMGRLDEALVYTQCALDIFIVISNESSTWVAKAENSLGNIYALQGDFKHAKECFTRALNLYEKISQDANILDEAHTLNNLGDFNRTLGEYCKAEENHKLAMKNFVKISQHNYQYTSDIAVTFYKQGIVYSLMNQYTKAEKCYAWALARFMKRSRGTDQEYIAWTFKGMGNMYRLRKRFCKAEECFRQAIISYRDVIGKDRTEKAQTWKLLGDCYNNSEQRNEAEQCYNEALKIFRAQNGAEGVRLALTHLNRGKNYKQMRMRLYKKEEACYDDANAVCAKAEAISVYLNILDGL